MSNFSPSDAALEGFRLTRERPGTILAWAGVYFAGIMLMALVMVIGIGPKFIAFIKDGGLQSGDTEAFGTLLAQSWPAFLVVLAAAVFLLSILTAGIYRLVLRPKEPGFAHLKLGADEVRLALIHLILFAIGMVFLVAIDLVVGIGRSADGGGAVLMSLLGLILAVLMVWVGVRLSLATPMTFAEHHLSLAAAWRLTRGRFWRLFGMIMLAVIFYVMIWMLISIIAVLFITLAGGAEAVQNLGAHSSPVALIAFAVTFFIQLLLPILQVVMIYSPFAVAYEKLIAPEPAPAEAVIEA